MAQATLFSTFIPTEAADERQARLCLSSFISVGGLKPSQILVHRIEGSRTDLDRDLLRIGVRRLEVPAPKGPFKSLEKLVQLQTLVRAKTDRIVLFSPGMLATRHIDVPWPDTLAGKLVDAPRPDLAVLETLFRTAGLPFGATVGMTVGDTGKKARTHHNNLNNRFLVFSTSAFKHIAKSWQKWAQWLVVNRGLTDGVEPQADQVSLALALSELKMTSDLLDMSWNFPAHMPASLLKDRETRFVFCHRHIDEQGLAQPTGLPKIDKALADINAAHKRFWADLERKPAGSPQKTGSKPARGAPTLPSKKQGTATEQQPLTPNPRKPADLMRYLTTGFEDASVLQIGLGDSALVRSLSLGSYTGYDFDKARVSQLKKRFSDRSFQILSDDRFTYLPQADLVVALDEPFAHTDPQLYVERLRHLSDAVGRRLVLRGYDYTPTRDSGYHGSILEHLKSLKLFKSVLPIYRDREELVLVADKLLPGEDLETEVGKSERMFDALTLTERPALLSNLADLARHHFGFFSTDFLRAVEHPWALSRAVKLHSGTRHLDVGTGLSSLPIFTARQGASVVTVDNHPVSATESNRADWPLAGFYDYSKLDGRCSSHNIDILDYSDGQRFDLITVLAVLHLMPQKTRQALFRQLRDMLAPDGDVFISVRLIPRTDWIWNHRGADRLAPKELHGHLVGLQDLLLEAGFDIVEQTTLRAVPNSQHNDVWMAHIRRA